MARIIQRAVRRVLPYLLPYLDFPAKMDLAAKVLEECGFGSGAAVDNSNEIVAFEFVRRPQPVLIDVGAHLGDYTRAFLSRFKAGIAYCAEPVMTHYQLLQAAMKDVDRVRVVNLALSDRSGEGVLYRNREVSGLASFSRRRLDHFGIGMDIEERVTVTTLDQFADDLGINTAIDLLKLDVEGHELHVLGGAKRLLSERRIGAVQFEFGGCNLDSRTTFQDFYYFFIKEHDFSIYVISRHGLQKISNYSEIYEQYRTTNFVAVRNA